MDAKTEQKRRLAELVVQRGFATGFILDETHRRLTFHFTDDGLHLKMLLRRLMKVDETEFTHDEFMDIILFFIVGRDRV